MIRTQIFVTRKMLHFLLTTMLLIQLRAVYCVREIERRTHNMKTTVNFDNFYESNSPAMQITPTTDILLTTDSVNEMLIENERVSTKQSDEVDPTPQIPASSSSNGLNMLHLVSFLQAFSNVLVAFLAAPYLIGELGAERATARLSALRAGAALLEIALAPAVGAVIDSVGRKPLLLTLILINSLGNAVAAVHQSPKSICIAKFLAMLYWGFYLLCAQAMISDVAASNPRRVGTEMGKLTSLFSAGLIIGSFGVGKMSKFGISVNYSIAAVFGAACFILGNFVVPETLMAEHRTKFDFNKVKKLLLKSPLSCTALLCNRGKEVRILAILLLMQMLPLNMGEFIQIFGKTEWGLTTEGFASLIGFFGVMGIFSNLAASVLVPKLGTKRFTSTAILSALCSPIAAILFGFKGFLVGICVGFLGMAQTLGTISQLVSQGEKSGVPQGVMTGERSSVIALLKVIGPLFYSGLYIKGQKSFGTRTLPFFFNAAVSLSAFVICMLWFPL